jgi:hypothetical protein
LVPPTKRLNVTRPVFRFARHEVIQRPPQESVGVRTIPARTQSLSFAIFSSFEAFMNTDTDIPDDFREAVFPDYVRIVTANAVIGAQYVERVLNAICLVLQTDGLRFSIEDFMSDDASRTRQTLGSIEQQLRKTNLFVRGA